jgi:hypothetical protein
VGLISNDVQHVNRRPNEWVQVGCLQISMHESTRLFLICGGQDLRW